LFPESLSDHNNGPAFQLEPRCPFAVTFGSGVVTRFPPGHPDRDRILREVQFNFQEGRPVGVLVTGNGHILELTHAHETCVDSVREVEKDNTPLAIWFWEYSLSCYLPRDRPEFHRIRATLEQTAATGERVWLVNRLRMVESDTEIWWKILDVRLLAAPPEGREMVRTSEEAKRRSTYGSRRHRRSSRCALSRARTLSEEVRDYQVCLCC
jgi:hypothetical protein